MNLNSRWTLFAIDAEVEYYGTTRLCATHNALRDALVEIIQMDERSMYERCPNCPYDSCQESKRCKDVPYSVIGIKARSALDGIRK
jgi:hypothetical protein